MGSGGSNDAPWSEIQSNIEKLVLDRAAEVNILADPGSMVILGVRGPAESLLGCSNEQLQGADLIRLRPNGTPGPRKLAFGPELLAQAGFYGEVIVGHVDGSHRTVALWVQPFNTGSGKPLLFLRMLDVTEQLKHNSELRRLHKELREAYRKLSEQRKALEEARRAASLSHFAAGLAHELNNPVGVATSNLNSLGGYLRDLARDHFSDTAVPEELEEAFAITRDVSDALARIADIVSRLTELEAPVRQDQFDLVELVKTHGKRLGLRSLRTRRRLPMSSDSKLVLSMLEKVTENAKLANGEERAVTMEIRSQDDQIVLHIDDCGPGVSEEIKDRVFDPFFTTRPPGQGLGLGLFLARKAAANLGGEIGLDNRPQGGTRVTIRIPRNLPRRPDLTVSYEGFRVKAPRRAKQPEKRLKIDRSLGE